MTIERPCAVIPANVPHIVPEPEAPGWLVVHRSYGWLYGSRSDALRALRDLTEEVRR